MVDLVSCGRHGRVLFLALGVLGTLASVAAAQFPLRAFHLHDLAGGVLAVPHQAVRFTGFELSASSERGDPLHRWLNGSSENGSSEEQARPRPGPNVPEPMVFDLIRPLGVRRGEVEVNVLGFVPLRRTRSRTPQFSFITGADASTKKRAAYELAPEIEFGLFDNFALEFELPMAETTVEAYKGAAQYTFGTAFNDQFIHGLQGILFIDRSNGAVSPTLLYLAALRFDSTYSMLGMIGFSHEFGGDNPRSPTQILFNATLFAELSDQWTLGLEVNYAAELDGAAALLFMPQVHWNPDEHTSLQFGIGTRASEGNFIGEIAFRLVRSF